MKQDKLEKLKNDIDKLELANLTLEEKKSEIDKKINKNKLAIKEKKEQIEFEEALILRKLAGDNNISFTEAIELLNQKSNEVLKNEEKNSI